MLTTSQEKKRGAFDFAYYYDNACLMKDLMPISLVKANLNNGVIDIFVDSLKYSDWAPILESIKINRNLRVFSFKSKYSGNSDFMYPTRKPSFITNHNLVTNLCSALKDCLSISNEIRFIELFDLGTFIEEDINLLKQGIDKNCSLNHLSLEGCFISDENCKLLCEGIRYIANISTLNLSRCNLTKTGAKEISSLIKSQALQRHTTAWKDSLRYRRPELDRCGGLRRVTLNQNPNIGDDGALYLVDMLWDDLWLKALDLQACNLTDKSAKAWFALLSGRSGEDKEYLKSGNQTLLVLDLRRNPAINRDLLRAVTEKVLMNSLGRQVEYKWLKTHPDAQPRKICGDMMATNWPGIVSNGLLISRNNPKNPIQKPPFRNEPSNTNASISHAFKPPFLAGKPNSITRHKDDVKKFLTQRPPSRSSIGSSTLKRPQSASSRGAGKVTSPEPWKLGYKSTKSKKRQLTLDEILAEKAMKESYRSYARSINSSRKEGTSISSLEQRPWNFGTYSKSSFQSKDDSDVRYKQQIRKLLMKNARLKVDLENQKKKNRLLHKEDSNIGFSKNEDGSFKASPLGYTEDIHKLTEEHEPLIKEVAELVQLRENLQRSMKEIVTFIDVIKDKEMTKYLDEKTMEQLHNAVEKLTVAHDFVEENYNSIEIAPIYDTSLPVSKRSENEGNALQTSQDSPAYIDRKLSINSQHSNTNFDIQNSPVDSGTETNSIVDEPTRYNIDFSDEEPVLAAIEDKQKDNSSIDFPLLNLGRMERVKSNSSEVSEIDIKVETDVEELDEVESLQSTVSPDIGKDDKSLGISTRSFSGLDILSKY